MLWNTVNLEGILFYRCSNFLHILDTQIVYQHISSLVPISSVWYTHMREEGMGMRLDIVLYNHYAGQERIRTGD